MRDDDPPRWTPHRAFVNRAGLPCCGKCHRRIQHRDQWRCPYVTCGVWLRGTNDRRAVRA